jgi:hypothetical protein
VEHNFTWNKIDWTARWCGDIGMGWSVFSLAPFGSGELYAHMFWFDLPRKCGLGRIKAQLKRRF